MSTSTAPPPVLDIDDATAARAALYGLLADALEFPSREFHTQVEVGVFRDAVEVLVGALPYGIDMTAVAPGLAEAGDYTTFQGEYIRIFDVGTVRPPCPLYDGEWGGARKHAMEEVLRFYRFFGMKLDDGTHELPDHIVIELEFMKVLAHLEGMATAGAGDVVPFLRAERDFLQRHPAKWWPLLQKKLPPLAPQPFYASLVAVVGAVLAADYAYVKTRLAESPAAA